MRQAHLAPPATRVPARRRFLKQGLAALGGLASVMPTLADTPLRVAVVPQMPALDLHRAWTPLLERVSARTGLQLQMVQTASIPAFEALFQRGEAELIFANPYHMVMARAAQQYEPLVRDGAQALTGVLVVASHSPLARVDDLRGAEIAFPSPNAYGASLYMRALLAQRGVAIQPRYVRTHSNAYRQVVSGLVPAAGGVRHTLERESPEVRAALRVLFETPPSAPHPLAAHPRVPAPQRGLITQALLELADREPALLGPVQMPRPVAADYRRDYAPLERLDLQRFVVAGEP
jgi:phosphonate transport system substrate-binding protein